MSAPWAALANAIAEGITLAAETICPRDHVGERRHRAVEAALAGEPGLSDDELIAVRGLIQERYPMFCGCGRELYGEPERPGGPVYWFHRDDDTPIAEQCNNSRPNCVPALHNSPQERRTDEHF